MKRVKVILILVAISLVGAGVTSLLYSTLVYHEVRKVSMSLEVTDKLGLNTDTDHLNFGANFPGNTNKRFLELSFPKRTRVVIETKGDLGPWIDVSANGFVLEPHEMKKVNFTAYIPEDTEHGIYEGSAVIYFEKI